MSDDVARLLVSIEATQKTFSKQLERIARDGAQTAAKIESDFQRANDRSGRSFENSGRRAVNTMGQSRQAAANLSFQLNDIATQLAGGQSPFLIAVQQGSQITQVLNGAGGATGAVSALGAAFGSMLNPISLATFAIIALGGSAVQYFTSLLTEADKSEEALAKQAQLIQQVAQEWGDAVPALKAYADELERAKKIADLKQGADLVNTDTLETTRKDIENAGVSIAELVRQLQEAGEETETILALQRAFEAFAGAAKDGSLKIEDVQGVQDALSSAINSTGIPALADFATMFERVSAAALNAAGSVQSLNAQTGAARAGLYPTRGAYDGVDRSADGNIQNGGFMTPENGPTPESRPLIEFLALARSSGGGGGRSKAISEAEREKKAVADLIEQLQFERDTINMTDQQRQVATALRRVGSAATEEERAKIEQLVAAKYRETEALKASKEAMQEIGQLSKSVFSGMISDLRAGKDGAEILANALDRVADKLIDMALNSAFGGGGGGGLGGFFQGLFGGGRAGGFQPNTTLGSFLATGYSGGGYTGNGGKFQPAGIVHKGEYVFDADATRRIGASNLERLAGYAKGGLVGGKVSAGSLPGGNMSVTIVNNSSAKISEERTETAGGLDLKLIIDDAVAENIATPGSASRGALSSSFGLKSGLARR